MTIDLELETLFDYVDNVFLVEVHSNQYQHVGP